MYNVEKSTESFHIVEDIRAQLSMQEHRLDELDDKIKDLEQLLLSKQVRYVHYISIFI